MASDASDPPGPAQPPARASGPASLLRRRQEMLAKTVVESLRQKEEVHHVTERVGLAVRAARMAVWEWDARTGRIAWLDGRADLLFQQPPESFNAFMAQVLAEDRSDLAVQLTRALHGGTAYHAEFRVRTDGDVPRWLEVQGEATVDADGKPFRLLGAAMDVTARKTAEVESRAYQAKLKRLAAELTTTQESERRRIAEGLHDEVGQLLAVTKMKLAALAADQPQAHELLTWVDQAIQHTRNFTFELSPPTLHRFGLVAGLESLIERWAPLHGLSMQVVAPPAATIAFDETERVVLYQCVRELAFNVVKHARAKTLVIEVGATATQRLVTVRDDGAGYSPAAQSTGLGLFHVRERMDQINGRVEIISGPGGTKVSLLLPPRPQPRGA